MRISLIVLLAGGLCACGGSGGNHVERYPNGITTKSALQIIENNTAECQSALRNSKKKVTAVEHTRCFTDAANTLSMGANQDLWDALLASMLANAERVDKGQMTPAQANEANAQKRVELTAEEQRRRLANQAAIARAAEVNAAMSQAAAAQRSATAQQDAASALRRATCPHGVVFC